ncbi:MAG: 4Fe-4S dicluster domain-containing protein [Thermodesulfobacteriota bacterium]
MKKARNKILWVHNANMFIPILCQHCEKPLCLGVCPTAAISQNGYSGAVVIDYEKCNGCKACVEICPLGAVIWDVDDWCVTKCDLCGGDPECVKHCLYSAICWVEADETAMAQKESGIRYLTEVLNKFKDI